MDLTVCVESRTFYMVHLLGLDLILGNLGQDIMQTILSAADIPDPIQLPGITGFILVHGSRRPNSE